MKNEYQEVPKPAMREFTANLQKVVEVVETFNEALKSMVNISPLCASMLELYMPFRNYAAAGYPLGKSIRGLKKWYKRNQAVRL